MHRQLTAVIAAATICTACTTQTYDPFVVEPQALDLRVQRIALPSVAVPEDLSIADSTLLALDESIATALTAAGFEVIGPDSVAAIWEPIIDDIGGFYDSRDGRVIEEKRKEAYERFADGLRERYGADAVAYAELIVVDAPYSDGNANWDGTSQSVAGFLDKLFEAIGAAADALAQTPHVSSLPVGTVHAVTLQIALEDLEGQELYVNWGGVEVIADDKTGEWFEPTETFQRFDRFNRAVEIALKDLLEGVGGEPQAASARQR